MGRECPGVTQSDGTYTVPVPSGTYTVIVVLAPGHVNQTRSALNVADGQTTQVNFTLQPSPPGGIGAETLVAGGVAAGLVIAAIAALFLRRRKQEEQTEELPKESLQSPSFEPLPPPPPPLLPPPPP